MTNGEKLKEVFPNGVLTSGGNNSYYWGDDILVSKNWWNAEYKEPTTPNDCETCIHNKGVLECDMYGCKYEPTTKNDLAQERYQDLIEYFGDEKVAKTILESRKEFKAWLERLRWNIKRVDELARELEQIKGTTKNDLEVDAVSRQAVLDLINADWKYENLEIEINNLPSVTPQESKTGHWILTDVEGYRVWHCHCSECGKDPQDFIGGSENWWLIKSNLPKFCPNCGSDNREVKE